jgi:hypothetical protein
VVWAWSMLPSRPVKEMSCALEKFWPR